MEKSRHAGKDGGHVGAADDCSSDVTAFRRRMALVTVAWASLKIVHFWASAISSGTKYTLPLDTFKITKDKNQNFRIQCRRSLFEAHVEKSRHAGKDGGHVGAADDCSSDVTAFRRRMALVTVAWASLKIVHFWASAISSGTKYFWIRVIGGQQCCCFNFGS